MNYLKYLVEEIHTTVMAMVDNNGLPVTCAIDIMDYDESGLYFLTAKGKNLYERLKQKGYVALTGMKGSDTLSCASVSVNGKAKEIGSEPLDRLFEKNSYMKEIYPTEESRKVLTVFRIYEGNGEWFDLSKKPIERASFTFGNGQKINEGYMIDDSCVGCKACEAVCPQGCIDFSTISVIIIHKNCLHCGNCMTVCPHNAVIKRGKTMTQAEKRKYLITELLKELPEYKSIQIPTNETEQKKLLRSLFNIRMPLPVSDDFIAIQDEYLHEETRRKGMTSLEELEPVEPDIYLWQGDITTLACDAIVNAANSEMLGCFCPCHGCIDNAIHTFAGVKLRLKCAEIMKMQGHKEETGKAKLTPAYNLPCKYILHTVGPIVGRRLTQQDCDLLSSCYLSCLELAEQNDIHSIAFCCISTGEFHFPSDKAAEIAIKTVKDFKRHTNSKIKVVFNVFKDMDYEIYRELLG